MIKRLLVFSCFYLCACALPEGQYSDQNFVSRNDIVVSGLVREGLDYYSRSRFDLAEENLRQARWLEPDNDNIKLNLGLVLGASSQYAEAEELYEEVSDGDVLKMLFRRAALSLKKNDYEESLSFYRQAFDMGLDKSSAPAVMATAARNISVIHFLLGENEEALSWAGIGYEIDAASNRFRYVRLLLAGGCSTKAEVVLDSVFSAGTVPEDLPDMGFLLALLRLEQGDYNEFARILLMLEQSGKIPEIVEGQVGLCSTIIHLKAQLDSPDDELDEELIDALSDEGFEDLGDAIYLPESVFQLVADTRSRVTNLEQEDEI